ncbi:MAG TPA: ABC transporter substrate-binding protein, partial [Syntrophorhabdales bacterium]|nr:ABC transporter substrate-binding protein [Syntrophorhabdales bacterium]
MKRVILVWGVVLALVAVAGYAPAKETIKLGLITPLTGDVKTFGESSKNAFLIAIEDYSKTGKYQISPVIADDRNDATEGTNAALKLITQDKVAGIIGPLTSKIAIPVSEIADKSGVLM